MLVLAKIKPIWLDEVLKHIFFYFVSFYMAQNSQAFLTVVQQKTKYIKVILTTNSSKT